MATLSVRLDDNTKNQFSSFCDNIGMSVSTAFAIFAKTVVREQRIPFDLSINDDNYPDSLVNSIKADEKEITKQKKNKVLKTYSTAEEAFADIK